MKIHQVIDHLISFLNLVCLDIAVWMLIYSDRAHLSGKIFSLDASRHLMERLPIPCHDPTECVETICHLSEQPNVSYIAVSSMSGYLCYSIDDGIIINGIFLGLTILIASILIGSRIYFQDQPNPSMQFNLICMLIACRLVCLIGSIVFAGHLFSDPSRFVQHIPLLGAYASQTILLF